jgi:hypothetical protein
VKRIIVDERLKGFVSQEEGLIGNPGHLLVWAATGQEIIDEHRKEPSELIVTSLDPSGLAAENLCQAVRGDTLLKRVSIVVVGSGVSGEQVRLRACRANHYFTPPLNHAEFAATVRQLISVAPRQKYGVLVSVDVEGSVRGIPFFAKTENLSISGILITASRSLKPGDLVELAFFLPAYGRIAMEAEVVRTQAREGKEVGYGARFISVSPVARGAIAAFVKSRSGGRPEGPRE